MTEPQHPQGNESPQQGQPQSPAYPPQTGPQPVQGGPQPPTAQGPPYAEHQVAIEQVPPTGEGNPRRKWLVWGTAAAAVPVLALGTFFGVSLMRGSESGAASPDKAASTFIDALKANDVTRASQFIVPEEANGLNSLMDHGAKKAQEGEGDGAKSSPNELLKGITVKTSGLKTTVSDLPVPAEGVKKVEFTDGTLDASYDPAKADPLMKDFVKAMDGQEDEPAKESGSIADARKESGRNPYAVAVKRGDSWYISPAYTTLEQTAQDEGIKPAASDDVKTTSYPSAEAAAQAFTKAMVASVNSGSSDPILATLSPYEARILKRYQSLGSEESGESDTSARVISNTFEKPTNDGDRVRIRPKDVQIEVSEDDDYSASTDSGVVSFRGGCVIADGDTSCSDPSGRLIDQYAKGLVVKRGVKGWNIEYFPTLIAVSSDIVKGAGRGELEDAAKDV